MKWSVSKEDIQKKIEKEFKGDPISVLYKRGTCWEIAGPDYPIDAQRLVKKTGKFISVYYGYYVNVKGIPMNLGKEDIIEKRRSVGTGAHYCKILEKKGIKLPVETLGENEEKKYIDALIEYASKGNLLSKAKKSNLQLIVNEIVV